jgi:hypothetical protein
LARAANTSARFSPVCLPPEKNSAIFEALFCGNDARGEDGCSARQFRIFHNTITIQKLENLYRGVIVVEHLAENSLPDELLKSRLDELRAIAYHFQLCGRSITLDLMETIRTDMNFLHDGMRKGAPNHHYPACEMTIPRVEQLIETLKTMKVENVRLF